jgi:hypothetical protein
MKRDMKTDIQLEIYKAYAAKLEQELRRDIERCNAVDETGFRKWLDAMWIDAVGEVLEQR